MNLGEAYQAHDRHVLGETESQLSMRLEHRGASVQVSDDPGALSGTHVLTTLVLTHDQDLLSDVVEVVVPTTELDDVVLEAVTASVWFLLHMQTPVEGVSDLRHLHRSVPAFFERYGKSAFAFTQPFVFPEAFAQVDLELKGRTGRVWMGFFLSAAEVQFAEREGFDALTTVIEEQEVDVIDLARPSAR